MNLTLDRALAEAILGIDTLWGGDVMNPSGTGRFIADSWFSDDPLPQSYADATAAAVRAAGGLSAGEVDRAAIDAYLDAVNLREAFDVIASEGAAQPEVRGPFLAGLSTCIEVMWDLAMEALDRGEPVPYARSVEASTGAAPTPSDAAEKVAAVAALLDEAKYTGDSILEAADRWRGDRMVPAATIGALARAFIAELEAGTRTHVLPYLPEEMHGVPRSNVEFMPIQDAWFSGSMNYLGRERTPDGKPTYDASYEINAKLEISVPEYMHLVSHEVVPGHVMTFAYVQHLFVLGKVGFEGTMLTMNSRYSTLAEGIANNALLMAFGVNEIADLPDRDLQIGSLLALLQDDAKNQASYLTWHEGMEQPEVAAALRRDFLVSEERAEKLSGPWANHPILGRMYLPSYRAGTDQVAEWRRRHAPEVILPALYGCKGLVDVVTLNQVIG
ncbi:MAG: hypothetical protein V2I67_00195 [Thermoanaerobaculales bacterium]|jgi:hypothetical protein|nr:hypothetical protein [Thermoanaerobaculales bacterium]